jgi:uncharacterized protein (DUF433 family)
MIAHDRIEMDSRILLGKPVIRGTRLAVEFIVELLGNGWTEAHILNEYHDNLAPATAGEGALRCAQVGDPIRASHSCKPMISARLPRSILHPDYPPPATS